MRNTSVAYHSRLCACIATAESGHSAGTYRIVSIIVLEPPTCARLLSIGLIRPHTLQVMSALPEPGEEAAGLVRVSPGQTTAVQFEGHHAWRVAAVLSNRDWPPLRMDWENGVDISA